MSDMVTVHTADPILQLGSGTGDVIALFIVLVLLSSCAAKVWNRIKRSGKADADLEDENTDLGVQS